MLTRPAPGQVIRKWYWVEIWEEPVAVFDRAVNGDGVEVQHDLADTIGSGQTSGLVIDASGGEPVFVPGGDFILNAEFVRLGPDLMLVGEDGERLLVRDYFSADPPPDLVSDNGFTLKGATVEALAGPMAPAQYAQATAASTGDSRVACRSLCPTQGTRHERVV